jgi:cell division septum initiation protein DivIVA
VSFLIKLLCLLGQPTDKEDVDDLLSQLRQAEEQVNDLKERLKTTTSNVEQYRAMVTSLEESLNKEKQVCMTLKFTHVFTFFFNLELAKSKALWYAFDWHHSPYYLKVLESNKPYKRKTTKFINQGRKRVITVGI